MKFIFLIIFGLGLQANAGEKLACEAKAQGQHLKILFKERLFTGIYYAEELANFKIKCRDAGGVDDTGLCGHGPDVKFGFMDYYCVAAETVEADAIAKSGGDITRTKMEAVDNVYRKLRVQPNCTTSAGVENITVVSNNCRLEQ